MIDVAFDRVSKCYRIRRATAARWLGRVWGGQREEFWALRDVSFVAAHLDRSAARDAASWNRARLAGDPAGSFAAETRLWFFTGFLRERCPCVPRH